MLSAKAVDAAGNEATVDGKPGYRTRKIGESPKSTLTYRGTWVRRNVPRADGGKVQSGTAAAPGKPATTLTFTFTGSDVAIVSSLGPSRGRARVTIDGQSLGVIDLYSEAWSLRQVVFATHLAQGGSHTLKLKVLTDANPASTGTRVDIDAFLTLEKRSS
jgi:hypothetical protein